jgi:predicted permease
MLESIRKDVAYAWRAMRHSPGFFAVAVLSLGLGVGVNVAMFAVVDALLFRPLPVASPDTLVDVFTSSGDGDEYATTSYPDFLDLQRRDDVFSEVTAYSPMMAPLNLGDRARIVLGQVVTANHFTMLGIRPALGRLLDPGDDRPGAARVVVLSHRMWQREFGGDPAVVGRALTLRGQAYAIVGVAPASFTGVVPLLVPELWLPLQHVEDVEPAGIIDVVPSPGATARLERRGTRWMFVKGRLKPGVDAAAAHANVALLGRQLAEAYPATNRDRRMAAIPTRDVRLLVPQAGAPLSAGAAGVMAVTGLVLLIACANVAGLLLARSSARAREIGVRLALGASRGRLVQQLLVEGVVLGIAGAAVALGAAWALVQALERIPWPLPVEVVLDLRLDWRVTAFAIAAGALTGIVASLAPALKASRPSLVGDLKGEAPSMRGAGRRWALRDGLVVLQVALTAVLLVVAGLLLRSLGASERADVGFETRGLAAIAFDTDMSRYTPERGVEFWRQVLARARALPGVTAAGLVTPTLPFTFNFNQQELRIDTRTYAEGQRGDTIENVAVSPGYLTALGARVLEGRDVDATDVPGAPDVVLVNDVMARAYWPGASAVGHVVTVASTGRRSRVVGVVSDYKRHGVLEAPAPFAYFAADQRPARYNFLLARTSGDAAALVSALRRELLTMEPGLVFTEARTMEQALASTLVPARVGAWLAAGFGALGIALASIGLYGVLAFSVARRTREIGVRIALGATPSQVLALVLRQGFTLVGVGLALGAGLAAAAAVALRGLLYGVAALDPGAWLATVAVLAVAATIAHVVPVRRALGVAPTTALRAE